MKVQIVLLFQISILVSCSSGSFSENDVTKNGLKGKVKTLKNTRFNLIDKLGKLEKESPGVDSEMTTFSDKGSIMSRTDGLMQTYTLYNYDSGRLTSTVEYALSDSMLQEKTLYFYDEERKLRGESSFTEKGDLHFKITYDYDANKKLVLRRFMSFPVKLKMHQFAGPSTDTISDDSEHDTVDFGDGVTGNSIKYKYDDRGRLIFYEITPMKGKSVIDSSGYELTTYKYGEKYVLEQRVLNREGFVSMMTYTYNTIPLLTQIDFKTMNEHSYFDDIQGKETWGIENRKFVYTYNDSRQLVSMVEYLNDNLSKTETYEYDSYGNWTRLITDRNNKKELQERELEYY